MKPILSLVSLFSISSSGYVGAFQGPAGMVQFSRAQSRSTTLLQSTSEADTKAEGLPWWWELVWKLDIMKKGNEGEDIIFGDSANVLRTNIEQIYGGYDSLDGCPIAEGEITDIADGTMFVGLQTYQNRYQSPYKLCFGPKSFLVISDPVQARHLLRDANVNYDKVSDAAHLLSSFIKNGANFLSFPSL